MPFNRLWTLAIASCLLCGAGCSNSTNDLAQIKSEAESAKGELANVKKELAAVRAELERLKAVAAEKPPAALGPRYVVSSFAAGDNSRIHHGAYLVDTHTGEVFKVGEDGPPKSVGQLSK